jgi:hypothetical protein
VKKLRSFIYLDNYKMYSFSSQLFEGLTEYIVKSEETKIQEEKTQKGQFGSGRIIGDIIEKNSLQSEKKFLHDYSYNLFEEKLIEQNRVLEISSDNFKENIEKYSEISFVKISGRAIFNDAKILEENITNYNKFGEAIGYVSNFKEIMETKANNSQIDNIVDRNKKAKLNAISNSQNNYFKKILKDKGLSLDEKYLEEVGYLLNYGYNQQFEFQIPFVDLNENCSLFSAQLIRENLKENEYNIIKKYSRESEKEFKLFGVLTQTLNEENRKQYFTDIREKIGKQRNGEGNMKEGILGIIEHIANVENLFIGKLDYEYVVDPIAIYIEI